MSWGDIYTKSWFGEPGRYQQYINEKVLPSPPAPGGAPFFGFDSDLNFIQPDDFATLPCNFYRTSVEHPTVLHDFDFDQYTDGATDVTVGFVGADHQTFKSAFNDIAGRADGTYNIIAEPKEYPVSAIIPTVTLTNKVVTVQPRSPGRILMTDQNISLSWTDQTGGVWQTTRSVASQVFDYRDQDENGVYIPYTKVATLAECEAAIRTWYTNGSLVYVHTADGLQPTIEFIGVTYPVDPPNVTLSGTSKLYLKDCDFAVGGNVSSLSVTGNYTGEFCAHNCTFSGARPDTGNTLAINGIVNTYLFDCRAAYSVLDGFNYHYAGVPDANRRDCLVVEYNCKGYSNGLNVSGQTNNGSTCHEGVCIIRFNGDYYNSRGPVCVDVNGCYSILVDCNSKDSTINNSVYYFNNSGNPTGILGKLRMYNCTHNDETYNSTDLFIDVGFDAILYDTPLTNLKDGSGTPIYEYN